MRLLSVATFFAFLIASSAGAQQVSNNPTSPAVGTFSGVVGAGKNACDTVITIESIEADGTVKGSLHISGGACGDTKRVFGEDQSPPIHTRFDGTWMKIWYLTNGTRLALKYGGNQFAGRLINVGAGGTTGITDIQENAEPVGDPQKLQKLPGTRETPFDVVLKRAS